MGASLFQDDQRGTTLEVAYRNAVQSAGHEFGFGGYSGTIATTNGYIEIEVPEGISASTKWEAITDIYFSEQNLEKWAGEGWDIKAFKNSKVAKRQKCFAFKLGEPKYRNEYVEKYETEAREQSGERWGFFGIAAE